MREQSTRTLDDVRQAPPESQDTASGGGPWRQWAPLLVPVAATVVGARAAARGDQAAIGSWGLIQALPWPYFVAVASVAVSSTFRLVRRREQPLSRQAELVLALHLVSVVFLLHGAPALLEAEPRFATAWLHAGFTEQILSDGVARPEVDARFSWPGFFTAAATVAGAAGLEDPVALLRWAPVTAVLLYLPPLYLLGRHLTVSRRAAWLALFLFVPVNWVGQDYFAPQSLGFVMYLWWLTPLVLLFRDGDQLRLGRRLTTWRARIPFDGERDLVATRTVRVSAIVTVLLLTAAVAVSHQLTPLMLASVSAGLVLAGRLRLTALPVLTVLISIGWLSLGATTYWVGHLDDIFGAFGDVGATVGGVEERVTGSPEHLAIVRLRAAFSVAAWGLSAFAAWFLWVRRHQPPLTLLVLLGAPFVVAITQPYGGEGMLRVFLFSCPFACMVMARAVLEVRGLRRVTDLTVMTAAVALLPLFLLLRYGNESFEQVHSEEVRALKVLYELAPPGSNIVSPVSQVPWRFSHAADHDYGRPADPEGFLAGDLEAIRGLVAEDDADAPATYLVVTRSQKIYAKEALGEPDRWFVATVRPMLRPANGYRIVYRNPFAIVYEYSGVDSDQRGP